jgi:excinuclease ABC subunit A
MKELIKVRGARENNLKNLNVDIPKNKLVVITGLSGSGKSSLAFDTVYAEGQRRYLESLSSYARQFLGGNEKPDVDSIEGLSPAISIDQKTTSHNPRSTVGTVTEIFDYLRLLYARIGKPHCVNGHGKIESQSPKKIVDRLLEHKDGTKLQILSPLATNEKGTFKNELEKLKKEGYQRVRINGDMITLDEQIELDKNKRHTIHIVVDRIIVNKDQQTRSRVFDSVEVALKQGNGTMIALIEDEEVLFSENYSCKKCDFAVPDLEPRLFSFNSPIGACHYCKGLGFTYEVDDDMLIPDKKLTILGGGVDYFKNTVNTTSIDWQIFKSLLKFYKIPLETPISNLSNDQIDIILHGSREEIEYELISSSGSLYRKNERIEGVSELIKRRHLETSSEMAREFYSKYMSEKKCQTCNGQRLSKEALCVLINDKNIVDVTDLNIKSELEFFLSVTLTKEEQQIANLALKEIINRLSFLENVGLNYLTLSRSASTLSGGESQRIRLATQIGSQLTNVLYVLDEPSVGLHQKDNDKLISALKKMRDLGNTLIVVEHDEETMMESDYLIDIGPGAGINGGQLIAAGTPEEVMKNKKSITGKYLSGEKSIELPRKRRSGNGLTLEIKGCTGNNLKNVSATIPLGKFVAVTGVSGSGKSTLIYDTLVKVIEKSLTNPFVKSEPYKEIKGLHNIDKMIVVSQEPIGRTPRSNPATYVTVFDDIRDIFSMTPESKARGYEKGRFSFNVKGGRCERCQGDGTIRIEMHFLPDVYVKCEDCEGKRYNEETLQVKFKGKSVYDVLEMNVDQAIEFFESFANVHKKLSLMKDVGLGYIKLGAPAVNLSGGEAQRIKLAKFLQRRATGKTLFVLDEPTTGLHTDDVARLIQVLNTIVDSGETVIVIEHNLDVIKVADHVIDIGPDGGDNGGNVVATGTPEQIISKPKLTHTSEYLKKIMERDLLRFNGKKK